MKISTVRQAAQSLRRAINTTEWQNRLDALGIKIWITNGPDETYAYGIQIRYEGIDPNLMSSQISHHVGSSDMQETIHVIADMETESSDTYGIFAGAKSDYCREHAEWNWRKSVYMMDKDLRAEIKAAFGYPPSHEC
jgi:hypothetical protein